VRSSLQRLKDNQNLKAAKKPQQNKPRNTTPRLDARKVQNYQTEVLPTQPTPQSLKSLDKFNKFIVNDPGAIDQSR